MTRPPQQSPPKRRFASARSIALCFLVLCSHFFAGTHAEMKASWTPAENDGGDGGPLPLSSNQRDQLSQLEHAIRNSPDPSATLQQVAASNNMNPADLVDLLQRNAADRERAQQGGGGASQPRGGRGALASLAASAAHVARTHPRTTLVTVTALVSVAYVRGVAVPTTGWQVSSTRRGIVSSGRTTVFDPPTAHLQRLLQQQEAEATVNNSAGISHLWKDLDLSKLGSADGVVTHKKNKHIKRAVSAQATVDFGVIGDSESVLEIASDHVTSLLASRQLTEWGKGPKLVVSDEDDERLLLVLKGMGDFGRYGILELSVTDESDTDITLSTTSARDHWSGHVRISIVPVPLENAESGMMVRVSLLTTKAGRGRAPSRRLATTIVQGLAQSMAASIRARTQQSLARSAQSSRYTSATRQRAQQRRQSRATKEQAMEDMAEDRRRRWQRSNPNAGHYRPSGERTRSPNNAVY